jgi:hypothetical protein
MNPLAKLSDDEIVEEHTIQGANSHFISEMVRRLMVALASQGEATSKLTNRIWWLNARLLVFTAAIFGLTFALSWDVLKKLWGIV